MALVSALPVLERTCERKEGKAACASFEINIPIDAYRRYTTTESTFINCLTTEERLRTGGWLREGYIAKCGKRCK